MSSKTQCQNLYIYESESTQWRKVFHVTKESLDNFEHNKE